jgi:hypothetical protein
VSNRCGSADLPYVRGLLFLFLILAVGCTRSRTATPGEMLKAGSRDTVIPIDLNPKAQNGVWLIMMLPMEGAKIELELPDGRRLNQRNAISFDAEWEVTGQGQGMAAIAPGMYAKVNHNVFFTAEAPAGKYRIHADTNALRQDVPLGVMVLPAFGVEFVQISAAPRVEEGHYSGEKFEMAVSVKDHDRRIPDPTIVGRVARAGPDRVTPIGPWVPLTLRPVGDGTFLTDLPWTDAGDYRFAFDARGKRLNGKDFTTGMSMSAGIEQRLVKLLAVSDRPVDELGKGEVDRIDVDVRASVVIPGHYTFTAKMNSRGKQVAYAYRAVDLKSGETTVTVPFPHEQLEHIDDDGPYAISVEANQANGGVTGRTLDKPLTAASRPYSHAKFGHGRVYFTCAAQANPKSATGRAPFDQLAVTFDVVTAGGACEWSSSLGIVIGMSEIATTVEEGHGRLPAGAAKITLLFDGIEVEQKFAGKATHTRATGITCGKDYVILDKPFVLPVYAGGTFASGPAFDLFTEYPEIHLKRESMAAVNVAFHTRGLFDEPLHFSLDGLPAGVTIVKSFPEQPAKKIGGTIFYLNSDTSAVPGTYHLRARGRYRNTEHALAYTLIVDP